MIPIRRTARKEKQPPRKHGQQAHQDRVDPAIDLPGAHGEKAKTAEQDAAPLTERAPATVTSRGGSLLRLYFTRSFKRRQRPGSEARKAAYRKGDLTSRRDPDFCLPGAPTGGVSRPAAFNGTLRDLRED